jgi:lysozyme family protein
MKPGTANALSPLAVFAAMVLALSVLFVVANCKKRLPPPAPVAKLVPGPAPQEEPPVIMPPAPAPTQGSTPVRVLAQASPIAASPIASPSPPVKGAQPGHEPETKVVGRAVGLQADRWYAAKIKPVWRDSINKAVMLYERTQERYKTVERKRSDGVPAPIIFCLHMRESDNSFRAHLHEGSSLQHRTRYVPKGRLPAPKEPPYQWEVSAEDAVYVADKLQGQWKDLKWSIDRIESYNGLGYRKLGVPSPYLWSGTDIYKSGKYVSDGRFNRDAVDQQLGIVAVLKRMKERGIEIAFAP